MEEKSRIRKIWESMLNHFFITFFILVIIQIILLTLRKSIPVGIVVASFALLVLYVILFLINRIRLNVTRLLHHDLKFRDIITGYISSVIFTIILFSILYWGMTFVGAGYLKYGSCVDTSDTTRAVIESDPLAVTEFSHYTYFSAITFFTVGFGDICPMGASKTLTVLNALMGNAFTVLVLAIAITNYSSNKDKNN